MNRFGTDFNQDLSEPVFNFGLKLYNMQNCQNLLSLLAPSQLPPIAEKRQLDQNYEHTEFELLRQLYGDKAFNEMLK
jgi:hypothetical protein